MKKIIITVGSHFAGKSKTINKFLKPKLGIGERARKFFRNNQNGYILSQSFEEAERDIDYVIDGYAGFDLLVVAARPANEDLSYLEEAKAKFLNAGYLVNVVSIKMNADNQYYDKKADEILKYIDN